jgi:predicted ABC-type transport system involved in lysophospholipase L1 biosynthesis ATPase subunit
MVRVEASGGVRIRMQRLSHTYATEEGPLTVLHDLDLEVADGGYLTLTGPSGAGKSTLLSLLGGLEPLQSGELEVGDASLSDLGGDELAAYRRRTVGFVFQHYGLVPVLDALENVELSMTLSGVGREERRSRALELLAAVGLGERAHHRPVALSGGERQRVAIARAMANGPRMILADEPTGNLDEEVALSVLELLESLRRDHGCTLVVVTHNRAVAQRADLTRHLVEGRWAP